MELMKEKISHDDDDAKVFDEIEKTLKKHEESWATFFRTLGEQVWNVPNFVPMMNIQREWEFAKGLLDEVSKIHCLNIIEEHLRTIFQDPVQSLNFFRSFLQYCYGCIRIFHSF